MKLEKIRKKHSASYSSTYVYGNLCARFNRQYPKESIYKLEKILFLMQYESIKQYNLPLLAYNTYIYEGKIYLPYVSDLLRVAKAHPDTDDYYFIYSKVRKYKYDKMMKTLANKTEQELDIEIELLIRENKLQRGYFFFEPWDNKKMRKLARFMTNKKSWMFVFFGPIAFLWFLALLTVIINLIIPNSGFYTIKEGIQALIFLFPIFILCVYIVFLLPLKPTKFEIENGYLEE